MFSLVSQNKKVKLNRVNMKSDKIEACSTLLKENAQFQEHGKRAAASIFRNMKGRKQERSHLFH